MDLNNKELITEYEELLLGRKKKLSAYFFPYEKRGNERVALDLMRYAFETYLRWNPYELRDQLDMQTLRLLKLDSCVKYILFPLELNPETDLFYIAWRIYPKTIHISNKDLILRVYQQLLDGKIMKFPKEYFSGIQGVYRANVCLKYIVEQYLPSSSIEELYYFFASQKINVFLRQYKISGICRDLFGTPLNFLHSTLPTQQKNEFLYGFLCFKEQCKKLKFQ